MKVALVHDYLTQYGGGERTLEALAELFPDAPIFTLLYTPDRLKGRFFDKDIRTSFLQKIPLAAQHHRFFPWAMPLATEHLDLSEYDLVLSDSASFVKGIITNPNAIHISFCHPPLRYAWDDSQRYVAEYQAFPLFLKALTPFVLSAIRIWDFTAAQRPDILLANSQHVALRIRKYYGRDAAVIYPPVNTQFFSDNKRHAGTYALMVGRLLAYKRFALGIDACKKAKMPLHIVGDGPEAEYLKKRAKGLDVVFLGEISDTELALEYANCKCLLFPQEEDFGIVAVEAMASGVPVVALRRGGAAEIVEENISGVFVEEETPEAFAKALQSLDNQDFSENRIRESAKRFDRSRFLSAMKQIIDNAPLSRHPYVFSNPYSLTPIP